MIRAVAGILNSGISDWGLDWDETALLVQHEKQSYFKEIILGYFFKLLIEIHLLIYTLFTVHLCRLTSVILLLKRPYICLEFPLELLWSCCLSKAWSQSCALFGKNIWNDFTIGSWPKLVPWRVLHNKLSGQPLKRICDTQVKIFYEKYRKYLIRHQYLERIGFKPAILFHLKASHIFE